MSSSKQSARRVSKRGNVVKLIPVPDKAPQAMSLPIDQLDSYHGRRKIAHLLRDWHLRQPRQAHTWAVFSMRVGITARTISRFASEDTKAPQLHTVLRIMRGLGFTAVRFDVE